jgi:hypothetical protein
MTGGLLNALLRGLSASLPGKAAAPKKAASAGPEGPAPKPPAGSGLADDVMEQRVARLLAESNSLRRGQLIVLEARKLAAQAGEKWDSISERAEQIVSQTIEGNQQPVDGYTRLEPLTYLLMFPNKAPGLAEAAATRIVAEIGERIVGTSWTPDLFMLRTVFGPFPDGLEVQTIPIPERVPGLLESVVGKLNEAKAGSADPSQHDPLSAIAVTYRPMWDVKHGALSTYLGMPALKSGDGSSRSGDASSLGFGTPELKTRLDIALAERVASDIGTFLDSAGKILVGIQVHFDTLAASSRRIEFLRACAKVPATARHLVVFELLGAPPGVPVSRLHDICGELRRHSRAIIACVPLQTRDIALYRQAGFNAVGIDLASSKAPEHALIDQMQQFAIAADKAQIPCFVHGLRSTSLASSAAAAGFRYVDGPSVHSIVEGLQQLRRYGASDLYASLFSGARQTESAP